VARDRAALAEAPRQRPAARLADARDRQRDILRNAGGLPLAAGDGLILLGRQIGT
jgi:hypothetical protein